MASSHHPSPHAVSSPGDGDAPDNRAARRRPTLPVDADRKARLSADLPIAYVKARDRTPPRFRLRDPAPYPALSTPHSYPAPA